MDKRELLPGRPSMLDSLAHQAVQRALLNLCGAGQERLHCLDATAGNGHDTCMLADFCRGLPQNVGVTACDIQEQALENTRRRLEQHGLQAELVLCGHERAGEFLPADVRLACAMFNLGYLPAKDRKGAVTATKAQTSLQAVRFCCEKLLPQGVVSIHCYTGHEGGAEEFSAIKDFVSVLNPRQWRVLQVSDVNREHNLEYLFLLERLQEKSKKE